MALASCPGPSGAAAEFAHDAPGFEAGVGAFAGLRSRATFSSTIHEPTPPATSSSTPATRRRPPLLTRQHVH